MRDVRPYRFPLSIQLHLPPGFKTEPGFQRVLALLQELGFTGVELNIVRPEDADVEELEKLLAAHGLVLTMFATGATAKAEGLSLSDTEAAGRSRAVERCRYFLEFAARLGAGLIIGFLKGGPGAQRAEAAKCMADSLAQLAPRARAAGVPLLLEATNRYESAVANSLEEAATLLAGLEDSPLRILPDTFHMNIEERDMLAALKRHLPLLGSVHFSDNNRLLPGLGALDFRSVVEHLEGIGYRGGIGLEANIRGDMLDDIRSTMKYLDPLLRAER